MTQSINECQKRWIEIHHGMKCPVVCGKPLPCEDHPTAPIDTTKKLHNLMADFLIDLSNQGTVSGDKLVFEKFKPKFEELLNQERQRAVEEERTEIIKAYKQATGVQDDIFIRAISPNKGENAS